MVATLQSVVNLFSQVTQKISHKVSLHVMLMILTSERKNYASMARSNRIPYKKVHISINETDDYCKYIHNCLLSLIRKRISLGKKGVLIIDFTMIKKSFSNVLPTVTYDRDGCSGRSEKGLSTGFAAWSDGEITIPCDFIFWKRQKDVGKGYKKKSALVKELVLSLKNVILFDEIKLDGAFASEDIIKFLTEVGIPFTMRIPRNRVVDSKEGSYQLARHPALKFKRNEKYKTIQAKYKDIPCFFTAQKRKGRNNTHQIVYIISSVPRLAKEHVLAYDGRWVIEKFIRTSKQHLGLTDCQSTDESKQSAHIFSVMYSYTILQLIKFDKKKKSVEEVLHPIRRQKLIHSMADYINFKETFMH